MSVNTNVNLSHTTSLYYLISDRVAGRMLIYHLADECINTMQANIE
jgi:hypothetical protein